MVYKPTVTKSADIIYLVNHHRQHLAFGDTGNHFIDPTNNKMPPTSNFPDEIKLQHALY